ncbi:MAG: hypothetical protein PWQ97_336 [Tepidanaerobacteraceae bacterium]|nr:hypothetical protein [Tepidanaerobacteraceae bacterium]
MDFVYFVKFLIKTQDETKNYSSRKEGNKLATKNYSKK